MRLRRVCEQKNANEESRLAGTLEISAQFFFIFLIDYCGCVSSGMWERGRDKGRDKMQSRVFHSSSAATFVGRRLRRLDKTNLDSREGSIRARECARMRAFAWSHARDPFAWWISLPSYPAYNNLPRIGRPCALNEEFVFFSSFLGGAERWIGLFSSLKPLNIIYFKR